MFDRAAEDERLKVYTVSDSPTQVDGSPHAAGEVVTNLFVALHKCKPFETICVDKVCDLPEQRKECMQDEESAIAMWLTHMEKAKITVMKIHQVESLTLVKTLKISGTSRGQLRSCNSAFMTVSNIHIELHDLDIVLTAHDAEDCSPALALHCPAVLLNCKITAMSDSLPVMSYRHLAMRNCELIAGAAPALLLSVVPDMVGNTLRSGQGDAPAILWTQDIEARDADAVKAATKEIAKTNTLQRGSFNVRMHVARLRNPGLFQLFNGIL